MVFVCHPRKLEDVSYNDRLAALRKEIKLYMNVVINTEREKEEKLDMWTYGLAKESLDKMEVILYTVEGCMEMLGLKNLNILELIVPNDEDLKNEAQTDNKQYV